MNYNGDSSKMIMVVVIYNKDSDTRGITLSINKTDTTNYLKLLDNPIRIGERASGDV